MISATLSQIVLDTFTNISFGLIDHKNGVTTSEVFSSSITTLLVTIIPVISGAAGNAGSQ